MMKGMGRRREQGAVSLFVVIFAAMLMVVITISFVKLMIQDQTEASQNDLSQSAYDAAQAGVEDAKRLLLANKANPDNPQYQITTDPSQISCDMVAKGLGLVDASGSDASGTGGGVAVQTTNESGSGGNKYDEAYTCDEIMLNTPDFTVSPLPADQSVVVPITTTAGTNSVNLDWFTGSDAGGSANPAYPKTGGVAQLFPLTGWFPNEPPVLRVQLIRADTSEGGAGFSLDDLDVGESDTAQTGTLFLAPTSGAGLTAFSFGSDGRPAKPVNADNLVTPDGQAYPTATAPQPVKCLSGQFTSSATGYACAVNLSWSSPTTSGVYLRITPLYNSTSLNLNFGSSGVMFNNVEPQIDSTGRANTLYRRISTRVTYGDATFPYPVATVSTTGGFCKDYALVPAYQAGSCTP